MSGTNTSNTASGTGRPPCLPVGTGSAIRGITENLSFHSSPESFIASRIAAIQQDQDPHVLTKRSPVRAKILNRNVGILSSYNQIKEVLEHDLDADDNGQAPAFVANEAYQQLMDQFFPPPNLLLADGSSHSKMRRMWDARTEELMTCPFVDNISDVKEIWWSKQLSDIMKSMFGTVRGDPDDNAVYDEPIDLYDTMKTLSWRVLLRIFLDISDLPGDPPEDRDLFTRIQSLHENLLRGQFSLMPLSVNVRLWRSPRSLGIQSRKALQKRILERLHAMKTRQDHKKFAFTTVDDDIPIEETRDHVLMATSSLAVKGLASLLTAFLLNIFLFNSDGKTTAEKVRSMIDNKQPCEHYRRILENAYLETERLSPPIVGVMRRTIRDVVVSGQEGEADTILPAGWDVWSYFIGAGRDRSVFGETCNHYNPDRYIEEGVSEPLGFGTGPKSCLGKRLIRQIVLHVAEHLLVNDIALEGAISTPGLRAWLGWEEASPKQWAAEVKQLPTQRPKVAIMVRCIRQS